MEAQLVNGSAAGGQGDGDGQQVAMVAIGGDAIFDIATRVKRLYINTFSR